MSRTRFRGGPILRTGTVLAALVAACNVVAQTPIENDDCPNATPIVDGTYQGTTDGATVDGVPACSGLCQCYSGNSGTAPDVWYLYTATCDGILAVDTCGSEPFDTWLSIHEPGCSGAELACNEDACGPDGASYQSQIQTEVVQGEEYLIRVSGWAFEVGDFQLHVSCTSFDSPWEAGADHCASAVQLDVPTIVRGTTAGMDYDPEADRGIPGFPRTQGNWGCGRDQHAYFGWVPGVWYRVTGTGSRMTASVENLLPPSDTIVQVYCDGCARPICVSGGLNDRDSGSNSTPTSATWCSRAGETYLIWVAAAWVDSAGDFELTVTDDGTPCYGAVDCTPVEVIDTYLSDNGDHDGWADTNETVEMRFTVANRSTRSVTGLVARLASDDPKVAGVAENEVYIGALAAGETKLAPGAFTFRVADVDRAEVHDDFFVDLNVGFASDQFQDLAPRRCSITGIECENHSACTGSNVCDYSRCTISGVPCRWWGDCAGPGDECVGRCSVSGETCIAGDYKTFWPCEEVVDFCVEETQTVLLDLDLDAAGGTGATEFFESFESVAPSSFEEMNLDAGMNSLLASDGARCQYNPPGDAFREINACYPGTNPAQAGAYFWQLDDSRAFSGLRSLYMGIEVGPDDYTTPLANLEAAAITEPISLGAGRTCSGGRGDVCALDGDCPPGERCLAVIPELSFKHQISLVDDRGINPRGQASTSSGVVQVQVVDAEGGPIGPWQTIEPKLNRYDSVPTPHYYNCFFDPIDDGSTEYDRFDYTGADPPVGLIGMRYLSVGGWYVPHARGTYSSVLGPSSNCFPQHVFASAGDTDDPFDPDNLNGPVVGPGLRGELGLGTWVEPVFSLDRLRGRRIRVRFLTSSIKITTVMDDWRSSGFDVGRPGRPDDDGWWIDDVRVTHTLTEPATVTPDAKDNSNLAYDADGDFVADVSDCVPGDSQTWALPGEVLDLFLEHTGGLGGTTELRWGRAATTGATSVDYIVVTEEGALCSESTVGQSHSATDSVTPSPGALRQFLIQAANGCGRGPLGTNSLHTLRTGCD